MNAPTIEDQARSALRASMILNHECLEESKADGSLCRVAMRVLALEQVTGALAIALDENTRVTSAIKSDTAMLVQIAQTAQEIGAVGRWVGRAIAISYKFMLKFIMPLIVAGATIWAVWKTGKLP